ncbi:putative fatty acyl-CoA reductase CG5065, partial [Frankliniella occidentalis]|uniref:Fatty acyl-CoA reductase n=1 Tax=Frankliniella occidentalis TaxID=133901 RepID=A0A9C6XV24_FRAOC
MDLRPFVRSSVIFVAVGDLEEPVSYARCKARAKELFETWEHRDATIGDNFPTVNDFYRGRHLFVTGGSGFCGKVIVEKLLRSCPDVGNIYLLVRPGRRGQHPDDRLKDMLQLPLFDRLREENPAALNKVLAVRGDCMQKGLGLSPEDRQLLADKVSIVIHSAASVRFNDALKKAVTMNVLSTVAVVELAREMKKLSVLVHISTAYCNTNINPTMERIYPTEHNWRDVVKYVNLPDVDVLDDLGEKFMGFQPNSYVFTKALAEQVMNEAARDLPVIIIRPSI